MNPPFPISISFLIIGICSSLFFPFLNL